MKNALLVFDLPRELHVQRKKINRELHSMGAKMIQHSVWSSEDFYALIEVASFIKKVGGKASILEEKIIF